MKLVRQDPQYAMLVRLEHRIARLVFTLVAAPPELQTSPETLLKRFIPSLHAEWQDMKERLPPLVDKVRKPRWKGKIEALEDEDMDSDDAEEVQRMLVGKSEQS